MQSGYARFDGMMAGQRITAYVEVYGGNGQIEVSLLDRSGTTVRKMTVENTGSPSFTMPHDGTFYVRIYNPLWFSGGQKTVQASYTICSK